MGGCRQQKPRRQSICLITAILQNTAFQLIFIVMISYGNVNDTGETNLSGFTDSIKQLGSWSILSDKTGYT
jgi:hypothetical protein